jgi:hypothetical protein
VSPVPLPVVTSGLPVVGGAERAERTDPVQSDAPPKDVDSGWDD